MPHIKQYGTRVSYKGRIFHKEPIYLKIVRYMKQGEDISQATSYLNLLRYMKLSNNKSKDRDTLYVYIRSIAHVYVVKNSQPTTLVTLTQKIHRKFTNSRYGPPWMLVKYLYTCQTQSPPPQSNYTLSRKKWGIWEHLGT